MRRGFDLAAIRAQFPILEPGVHGRVLHYLDNGATAQMPKAVLDAIVRHETRHRANVKRSVHFLAEAASEAFDDAREAMARFVNAGSEEEIVFTSGCTGAINLVAHSYGSLLKPGDEVVISALSTTATSCPGTCWRSARAWW